ncbi:hypothetical protein V3851_15600 [Paenibacillus sp. M1]|uniref:DUF3993 domain-containing protein n=1 Tax=Paenibacillus haidiansis TaxID=1574488 RepID=A0ABU7VWI2_9BACL
MSNVLSHITAALLAVLLLFLFPAMQSAQREEDFRALAAYNSLMQFTDAVRNKGYISPDMYEDFAGELEAAGAVYDIELEHRHKKYHPEYDDPADSGTFKGDFTVVYDAYYTQDILPVIFPSSSAASDPGLRRYKLEAGDYLKVTLERRSRSSFDVFSDVLYGLTPGSGITQHLSYGGMVLNEDY